MPVDVPHFAPERTQLRFTEMNGGFSFNCPGVRWSGKQGSKGMPGEISIGVVCRDVGLLPEDEPALRMFFDDTVGPAIFAEFRRNQQMLIGQDFIKTREISTELVDRGCEVSGSVSIKF